MDGVQEYRVVTNLASAEYYSGMGAQTSIVTRGGGNKLNGDVFEYLRNSSLDANNYFDLPAMLRAGAFPSSAEINTAARWAVPSKRIRPFLCHLRGPAASHRQPALCRR